jgi:hypothetical protein
MERRTGAGPKAINDINWSRPYQARIGSTRVDHQGLFTNFSQTSSNFREINPPFHRHQNHLQFGGRPYMTMPLPALFRPRRHAPYFMAPMTVIAA